jgi:hypothetical protein
MILILIIAIALYLLLTGNLLGLAILILIYLVVE